MIKFSTVSLTAVILVIFLVHLLMLNDYASRHAPNHSWYEIAYTTADPKLGQLRIIPWANHNLRSLIAK